MIVLEGKTLWFELVLKIVKNLKNCNNSKIITRTRDVRRPWPLLFGAWVRGAFLVAVFFRNFFLIEKLNKYKKSKSLVFINLKFQPTEVASWRWALLLRRSWLCFGIFIFVNFGVECLVDRLIGFGGVVRSWFWFYLKSVRRKIISI